MKETLQLLELFFGLFGLGLSLNGIYKLFKQITGLREITPLNIEEQKKLDKDDLYRNIIAKINDEIKHSNKNNEDGYKHDKKIWLQQIILGTIITGVSLILSYSTSKMSDNGGCNNKHMHYHHHYHCQ